MLGVKVEADVDVLLVIVLSKDLPNSSVFPPKFNNKY